MRRLSGSRSRCCRVVRRVGAWAGMRISVVAAVAALALSSALATAASADEPVQLSVGHVVGLDAGNFLAGQLVAAFNKEHAGTYLHYDADSARAYSSVGTRFEGVDRIADIVFLYAGTVNALDEIVDLARKGRLQPIDGLPRYAEMIRPDDFFPNLLTPVKFDGHLWAVPLRVVPPCLVVKTVEGEAIKTWQDLANFAAKKRIAYSERPDLYVAWKTMLVQKGVSWIQKGRCAFDDPEFRNCFDLVEKIGRNAKFHDWDNCDVILAHADALFDLGAMLSHAKVVPLPCEGDPVVCPSTLSWYVGVSSEVSGPARAVAAEFLGAITSGDMQLKLCRLASSPPVRPSITKSEEFTKAFSPGSTIGTLGSITLQLRFERGGAPSRQIETIVSGALEQALKDPVGFEKVMADAAKQVNDILAAGTGSKE